MVLHGSNIFNLVNNPEMSLLCMCCLTMFLHYCIIDSPTVKEHNAVQGVAGGTSTSSLRVHVCFFFSSRDTEVRAK